MKDGATTLAVLWGGWLLFVIKAVPHRHNRNIGDTIFLVLLGLFTLFVLGMTVRFVYRLVMPRRRTSRNSDAA
jgi:heme/copper-type cytochrome/quinol oxidase subunit 2